MRQRAAARRRPPSSRGCGSASARTVQPRCVQTAEIAWNVLPSRKTNSRSSGRNFRPSGKSAGQAELHRGRARRRRRSARSERSEAAAWVADAPTTPAPMPSFDQEVAAVLLLVGHAVSFGPRSRRAGAAKRSVIGKRSIVMASVGQRTAHSPQRMQRSSSLTIAESGRPFASARAASARASRPRRARAPRTGRWRGSTRGRRPRSGCRARTSRGRRSSARGRRGSAPPAARPRACVVAGLDLGDAGAAADVERRRRLAVEQLEARDHPVVAGRELLDRRASTSSRARSRGEVLVDRARRALAVGDRLDQVARAEGHVAAGEDARRRGGERRRVDPDRAAGRQRDAVRAASGTTGRASGRWRACRRRPRASARPRRRSAGAKRPFSSKTETHAAQLDRRRRPSPRKRFGPRRGRKRDALLLRLLELLVPLRRPQHRHLVEALERDDRHLGGAAAQRGARRVEASFTRASVSRAELASAPRPRARARSAVRAASKATKPPPMTTTRRPRSMR